MPAPYPQPTRLSGGRLLLARAAWLFIVAFTTVMLGLAAPLWYIQLSETFANLSPAQELVLRNLGLTGILHASLIVGIEYLVVAAFLGVAIFIFWKRSDDWVAMAVSAALVTYIAWTGRALDALVSAGPVAAFLSNLVQVSGHVLSTAIFLFFPDGRFVPHWGRWLLPALIASALLWLAFPGTVFNFRDPFQVSLAGFALLMGWRSAGAAALVYRYLRRATPIQKQQTKWIFVALTIGVLGYLIYGLDRFVLPALQGGRFAGVVYDVVGVPVFFLILLIVPIAFAHALLRYRLWEIDTLINRALVYTLLTGGVALLYATVILLFQGVLAAFIGDQSGLAVATTTLLIAVLFHPWRRRVQAFVDRQFYREKYDAAKALAAFSASVRTEVELDRLTSRLTEVIAETMQPTSVSLWLRPLEHQTPTAEGQRMAASEGG